MQIDIDVCLTQEIVEVRNFLNPPKEEKNR